MRLRRSIGSLTCLVLLAALVSGCGESEGQKLAAYTIAISAPSSGPLSDRGRDMVDAAKLAVETVDGDTASTTLAIEVTNSAGGDAIAAISALAPIESPDYLTIDLTPPTAFERSENRISLLPSAEANGEAVAQLGAARAPNFLDPVGGPGKFNAAVKRGVENVIDRGGLATGAAGLPAGTEDYAGAMAGDELIVADNPQIAGVPPFTYVSPALTRDNYPPAGQRFFDAFIEQYDRTPDRFAIYAYEAVGLVIDAINRLEKADQPVTPSSVQRSAFAIKNRFSPVGHYDVLPNGATTLYVFQARGKDAPPPESALIEVRR